MRMRQMAMVYAEILLERRFCRVEYSATLIAAAQVIRHFGFHNRRQPTLQIIANQATRIVATHKFPLGSAQLQTE
jgi:hypothetical protein